jgi:H+-translocating NAD(P) transhydrogenase subunit alpha
VIKEGKITWPPPPPTLSVAPQAKTQAAPTAAPAEKKSLIPDPIKQYVPLILGGAALYWVGLNAPTAFMSHFTVFVLACFIGYQVIWSVTPALHTPLMSVTNAISGIIVIGALVQISAPGFFITVLAGLAILIASINIAGGFLVTRRMLEMFRK